MKSESATSSDETTNAVVLRFLEDQDEAHQQLESEAHLVHAIPRAGEVVNIEHQYHAVKTVVHNYDANGIEIHLGPSSDSPEEAKRKLCQSDTEA